MLKKQRCARCGNKLSGNYSYCPHCGVKLDDSDWGMLGKNDFMNANEGFNGMNLPAGFNSIFNMLMKNIENQLNQGKNKKDSKINKTGISISISGTGDGNPRISMQPIGNIEKKKVKEIPAREFSDEEIKRFQSFPRKEPKAEMKRFADKVVYEISVPGVESAKDVSIIKLENSLEIRAIAKNKSYFKIIPINLPILNYSVSEGKLILELKTE